MIIRKRKYQAEIERARSQGRGEVLAQNEIDRRFENLYNRINALENEVYAVKQELLKKKFTAVKKAVKGECKCKKNGEI